jgi:flagellar biosynthesis regulator FlbT
MQAQKLKIPPDEEFEKINKRIDELIACVIDDIIDIIYEQLSNIDKIKAKYEKYIEALKKEKKKIKERTSRKLISTLPEK